MLTFLRKIDAESKRTEIESTLGLGTYRDPKAGRTKVAEIAESWFASKVDVRRSTRSRYRGVLDLHVIPRWGTTAVADVQHEDIVTWLGTIMSDSVASGSPLSAATIRKIWVVLKGVLGYAVRTKKIAHNPAIGVPLPRYTPAEHVYLTDVQVEALAEACGEYRALILFLAYTGVRWGEATAVQIKHVDLKSRRVRIAQTWGSDKGKLYLEDSPKNHERRSVPIPAFLISELAKLIAGRKPEEYLFVAPRGGVLMIRNFMRRHFKGALITAGLGELGITLHKLRHTAASLAIASGADVKVVQTMLGHKTATLTLDTYGHLWPDRLDEVSDRLDAQRTKALEKARKKAEKAARKARELAEQLAALEAGDLAAAA
ncbi:tyrosine-type recombinase/integrase [Streptomyces rubellomurinus]|uniref:tyrosine-type recombinase/integrase n=1 Tax=Streptomyces rubellomurinus (strain ATCC 31215) TaxID=359131 RepID=UPI00069703BF|nr:site-specific integrase [Streptomyces rubellomurinus]